MSTSPLTKPTLKWSDNERPRPRPRHRGAFSENGGYGFIRPDTGEHDIFMHVSQCKGETPRVRADQRKGKPCANDVRFEGDGNEEAGAAPGMFKEPEAGGGALAEGLQKLLRGQQ
jgi:cold shock CspA family protein